MFNLNFPFHLLMTLTTLIKKQKYFLVIVQLGQQKDGGGKDELVLEQI